MSNPKVSVIIPCYNAGAFIPRCLSHLVEQTISSIEVICVDDGSQDDSVSAIRRFVQDYPNIVKLIENEHGGASKAREAGILASTGQFIGFCDADDFVDYSMYEEMYQRAIQDDSDVVVCAYDRLVDDSVVATEMRSFGDCCMDVSPESGWFTCVNTGLCNKLFKREVLMGRLSLEKPPRIMEDAMILMSLLPFIKKMSFCSKSYYYYCTLRGSSMSYLKKDDLPILIEDWKTVKSYVTSFNTQFQDIIDLMAFIHLGVSAPLRMLGMPKDQMRESYELVMSTLSESFPRYKNSKFLKGSYSKQFGNLKKISLAYRVHSAKMMLPALQAYKTLTSVLHFDIKW